MIGIPHLVDEFQRRKCRPPGAENGRENKKVRVHRNEFVIVERSIIPRCENIPSSFLTKDLKYFPRAVYGYFFLILFYFYQAAPLLRLNDIEISGLFKMIDDNVSRRRASR